MGCYTTSGERFGVWTWVDAGVAAEVWLSSVNESVA